MVWGAVLGISLQARCAALAGSGSLAAYGEISTFGALAAAITQLVVGPLSDKLRARGDRRTVFYFVGAIAAAVATFALYRAPSVSALLVAFVVLQTAMNVAIGPYQAIVPDFVAGPRIGVASGWMAAMQSAGNATGAVLATVLSNPSMLGAALALVLLASCVATFAHVRTRALQPLPAAWRLRATRTLIDLFISRAWVYVGFYTLLGYLFFFVRASLPRGFALDATMATGTCILLFTFVGAAGAALAARPADRMDERIVVTIGGGIVAICVFALAASHALAAIPVAIACAGVGWGIFLCADWAFACRMLPPGALATTMGVWNVAVVGPQMLAPLIATYVIFRFHALASPEGPRIAFAVAGIEILAGAAWIWRLPDSRSGK
jgi:MFS family permease